MESTGYIYIDKGNGAKLMDGGNPNSNANVLYLPPVGLYPTFYRFGIGEIVLQNRSGSTVVMAVGGRIDKTRWKAGQWTNVTTTYTDDTSDAQSAAAADFPLETLTANDGHIIACLDEFDVIDYLIGTASVGGVPVRDIAYSGPAGWSSFALTDCLVAPVSAGHWVAQETLVWFPVPADWIRMTVALHGTGVPVGYLGIRIRATTAPGTTAGVASSLSVARSVEPITGLSDGSSITVTSALGEAQVNALCDAFVGICSVAKHLNRFTVTIRTLG